MPPDQPTTTPTKPLTHGRSQPRGLATVPSSSSVTHAGRFGRMFGNLPVFEHRRESLAALGQAMVQELEDGELDKPLGEDDDDENTATLDGELRLPAGYTYFGQFVDHDITFDPVSSLTRQNDPDALDDFRSPRFDLDNLYGRGPSDQPYLYDDSGIHLLLGEPVSEDPRFAGPDLQRVQNNRATIGDPRNDENLIVSQLQSAMLRFHNAVVDGVKGDHAGWTDADVFKLAQQTVRWHYQWIVVHDFLRRLVGQEVLDDILPQTEYAASDTVKGAISRPVLRYYQFTGTPYMPVEFSVAAYRFGHSVVRPSYLINDIAKTDPPVAGASRIPLFSQTGEERQSLNGFRRLPGSWGVQWNFLLPHINGAEANPNLPQPSYKLDAVLSHPLGALPASVAGPEAVVAGFDPSIAQNLAVRNLLRGQMLGLPSGQDVSRAMGIEPLTDDELFTDIELAPEVLDDLSGYTPLWYYILKESEVRAASAHLGPVGGRIVAEVLIGLLAADPLSYLSVQPTWKPCLTSRVAGTFTLSDLINIAVPAAG